VTGGIYCRTANIDWERITRRYSHVLCTYLCCKRHHFAVAFS
jgi:hypothetical protein